MKLSHVQIEPTAAGAAAVIPSGVIEYHEDTKITYMSDGVTKTAFSTGATYTDENAQDAVGTILTDTATIDLTYNDGVPSITASVIDDSITFAKIQNITDNRLLGRSAGSAGDMQHITVGSGLALSSGTLSSNRLYGILDVKPTTDTPDDEFNTGSLDAKWTVVAGSSGTVSLFETGAGVQRYDLTSRPSWMLLQVGRTTVANIVQMRQDYTVPDGSSIVIAVTPIASGNGLGVPVNNTAAIGFGLNDNNTSFSSGNYAFMYFDAQVTVGPRCLVQSSIGSDFSGPESVPLGQVAYLRITRVGLAYSFFVSYSQGASWYLMGTKTAGAAFDNIWIFSSYSTNQSAAYAPIGGFDWIRLGTNNIDPW